MKVMNAKSWSFCAALLLASISAAQSGSDDAGSGGSGPVRMARISFAEGNVSWRPDDAANWSQASPNLPLQQGAQVWVTGRGRAEVQFDDGSTVRLGNDGVMSIQSLYSDSQGEFTELKLNDGTSSLHLKDKYSIFQVDTPYDSVKAAGPARFRVDVGSEVRVGVRNGSATLSANGGDTSLRSGDFVELRGADDAVRVRTLPREDSWDRFDEGREDELVGGVEHCPPNIAIVAGGLGHYGNWHEGPHNRWYWFPRVSAGWRPYYSGSWIWVNPFGWTWCSSEAWGWAPYHYGAWEEIDGRWGWCPGPYHQYWCPAVVHFSYYNGCYAWAPLCPDEVIYPNFLSIGFGSGNWWFNFSIGGCAVYRPGFRGGFCEPVVFNRHDFGHNRWDERFDGGRRFEAGNDHFVPRNSRFGTVSVSERDFGHGGHFRPLDGSGRQYFERGQSATAASGAFSGPVGARASAGSLTPSHTFHSGGSPSSLNRTLYRAPLDSRVAGSGEPFGRTI